MVLSYYYIRVWFFRGSQVHNPIYTYTPIYGLGRNLNPPYASTAYRRNFEISRISGLLGILSLKILVGSRLQKLFKIPEGKVSKLTYLIF